MYLNNQFVFIFENFFCNSSEFCSENKYKIESDNENVFIHIHFFFKNLSIFFVDFMFNTNNIYYVYLFFIFFYIKLTSFIKIKPLF